MCGGGGGVLTLYAIVPGAVGIFRLFELKNMKRRLMLIQCVVCNPMDLSTSEL